MTAKQTGIAEVLAQTAADGLRIELRLLKHGVVRQEGDARAMPPRRCDALKPRHRAAGGDLLFLRIVIALKAHAVFAPAGADLDHQPSRQRIDHRRAHAVQTAGIAVILVVEFAARMQLGKDHLHTGDAQLRMHVHRHAASVVLDGGAAVLVQLHAHAPGKAVGHLVDRVIDDLPKQVMQAAEAGRADVHARTHPDRVKPFKHLEHAGGISLCHENSPPCDSTTPYYN